eukprot:403362797
MNRQSQQHSNRNQSDRSKRSDSSDSSESVMQVISTHEHITEITKQQITAKYGQVIKMYIGENSNVQIFNGEVTVKSGGIALQANYPEQMSQKKLSNSILNPIQQEQSSEFLNDFFERLGKAAINDGMGNVSVDEFFKRKMYKKYTNDLNRLIPDEIKESIAYCSQMFTGDVNPLTEENKMEPPQMKDENSGNHQSNMIKSSVGSGKHDQPFSSTAQEQKQQPVKMHQDTSQEKDKEVQRTGTTPNAMSNVGGNNFNYNPNCSSIAGMQNPFLTRSNHPQSNTKF